MSVLLSLIGMTAFLFGFFYFQDKTSSNDLFVYFSYTCLLIAFYFPLLAIMNYTSSRPKRLSKREAQEARLSNWKLRKEARKASRVR